MHSIRFIALIAVGILVMAGPPDAADQPSVQPALDTTTSAAPADAAADFAIPWESVNSGGQPSGSANFSLNGNVGQAAIGQDGSVT